jgi:hypothetical protein
MKIISFIGLAIPFILIASCLNTKNIAESIIDENTINESSQEPLAIVDTKIKNKATEPEEFMDKKWLKYFGSIEPIDTISLKDIQSCSWHKFFIFLQFSEQGNYAMGDPWSGVDFGSYKLDNNTITFTPPLIVNRFDENYSIDKLYYSNELYYEGTPILKNDDESVIFYPHNVKKPAIGNIVKLNQTYCEKINVMTKINQNNILYALPDIGAKNLFHNNYYGNKSTEAKVLKLAKTNINNIMWYYVFVDFTDDEPSDGGGPYYYGWLLEEYLK